MKLKYLKESILIQEYLLTIFYYLDGITLVSTRAEPLWIPFDLEQY